MNPSYFRIRLPLDAATRRLCDWSGKSCIEAPQDTDSVSAVDLACDSQGRWRAAALFVSHEQGWTIFNDLSGHFSSIAAGSWAEFARNDAFLLAGYNDAIPCAELICIENGVIVRDFMDADDAPELSRNTGRLPSESSAPIESWIEAASFVDDDDLGFCEHGTLWLLA